MAHKVSENRTSDAGEAVRQSPRGKLPILSLAALGIVFGDIGTSPLYTFKTILGVAEAAPDAGVVLGALSLVLWTLFIVTTVKYVSFAMRVDNDGEGGILALMALLGAKKQKRPTIVAVGLFGAALIYGDGAITPAISVLSALEGLNMATPALQPYVVPAAVAILLAAFCHPVTGNGSARALLWPGDAGLVRRHRDDGDFGHRAASNSVRRTQSGLRSVLPVLTRGHRLLGAGRGVSLRHRRRGALCRYGSFRQRAHQTCLVCDRLSKPDPELCGAGRARA